MKKFSKCKDSGIECIGEIPAHWSIIHLKHFSEITLGKMLTNDDQGGYFYKPYLRSLNIQSEKVDISDVKEMWFSFEELKSLRLVKGDLLVNEGGDVGRTATWNEELSECYFQNSVNRVHIQNGFSHFFLYHFLLHHFTGYFDSVANRVSIPHLTKEKLSNVSFCFPPFSEQVQIVEYLDQKTSILDNLIQKKFRQIEFLKEHRTSIINQVVIKGLNSGVRMKDSGVELIGEIPEHWSSVFIRHYFDKIGSGITPRGGSEVYVDSGITFIRSQNVQFDGLHLADVVKITPETHQLMAGSQIKKGDLLLNITGASIGRCCVVDLDEEMNVNQHVCIIRTKKSLSTEFLNYFLQSETGQDQLLFYITGANREGLTGENIRNFKIPMPPLPEQHQIVEFLDKKTSEIDKQVNLENRKIDLLKEYRQSLISEVVTGKIDVRTN